MLRGIRVVEIGEMLAAPYAAKLVADLGADVVKVESAQGDPARSLEPRVSGRDGASSSVVFLYANTNKRGVGLDLDSSNGRGALRELLSGADLVIDDRAPGWWEAHDLGYAALAQDNPRLVQLSITPFGQTGPYRDYKAYPLNTFHASGEGYLTPVGSRLQPEVLDRPPTRHGRFGSEYKLATYGTTVALAAVLAARRSGVGCSIDLSKQEALVGLNHLELNKWLALGFRADRAAIAIQLGGIVPCQDGFLEFTFYEEHQWPRIGEAAR